MIYAVTEWVGQDSSSFFFDSNKVNPTKPFEVAYLGLLKKAVASPNKEIQTDLPGVLQERCGDYQDSMACWERLKTKPPCQIDEQVTVWID